MNSLRDLEWLSWTTAAVAVSVPVGYLVFARRKREVFEADFGNFLKLRPADDRDPSQFSSFLLCKGRFA